jgi:phospholipase A1
MNLMRRCLRLLPLAALGAAALASAQGSAAPVPASALSACAAVDAPADRLACYDRLAGRAAAPLTGVTPESSSPPASPPARPKESFGLYAVEHPAAPKPAAVFTAKVVGLGVGANGRPTVELEGGQLWELDSSDPVLANGDSVNITRATLGSFLMSTPKGRTHRVHRLR